MNPNRENGQYYPDDPEVIVLQETLLAMAFALQQPGRTDEDGIAPEFFETTARLVSTASWKFMPAGSPAYDGSRAWGLNYGWALVLDRDLSEGTFQDYSARYNILARVAERDDVRIKLTDRAGDEL